jgi:hypothetical protein
MIDSCQRIFLGYGVPEQGVSKQTIYAWKAGQAPARRERAAEESGCPSEPEQGHAAVDDPKNFPWARSAESGSGVLAGGVPGQRAPRLRADGDAEIE